MSLNYYNHLRFSERKQLLRMLNDRQLKVCLIRNDKMNATCRRTRPMNFLLDDVKLSHSIERNYFVKRFMALYKTSLALRFDERIQ